MARRGLDNPLPEHLVLTIVVTLTQPTALQPTSDSPVAAMMSRDVLPTATPATPGEDCPMPEMTSVNTNTSSVVVRSLAVIGAVTLGVLICAMVAFVFWRYHRLRASVLRRPCKSDDSRSRRSSRSPTPTPVTPYPYDHHPNITDIPGRKIPTSWLFPDYERPPSYTTEIPILLTPVPARVRRASVLSQNSRLSTPTPADRDAEFLQQGFAY
ncbi:uncharacterized protein TRAVEDRAFT_73825 [Trametes versicolor FP-101664 SS1]|uniref:uncharacterized protein n=1 Tax=Trametes versicolor (strain FP-101664) TaxID=717944 RepID=UPI0004621FA2|nr:uncharacterized protein TRAVEDRAFT_73825 [Trametes versicolor FP-101664 SS1]EIW54629.1 hypothetical protein TRAVEDRAFT_73825 [Trametes versicolor FP-101664 SS1]